MPRRQIQRHLARHPVRTAGYAYGMSRAAYQYATNPRNMGPVRNAARRIQQEYRRYMNTPPRRANAPQRANLNKWGGRILNSRPKVARGKRATAKGTLTIAVSKKRLASIRRNFPQTCFQKLTFTSPTNYNTTLNTIKYRDYILSTSSVDAKHLSIVMVNLAKMSSMWGLHPIGNSLLSGAAEHILYQNNADNTALTGASVPYTTNRIPMDASPGGVGYKIPNHVITGVNLNLQFKSASVQDQWITCKLVRLVGDTPQDYNPTSPQLYEICNKQTVTDSRIAETVWQHSFFMPRITTQSSKPNRMVRLNKNIKCAYSRSTLRKISSPDASEGLGAMVSPHFALDTSATPHFFNNLYVLMTSKVVDEQFVSTQTYTEPITTSPYTLHTVEQPTLLDLSSHNPITGLGTNFAQFQYSGTLSVWNRIEAFTRVSTHTTEEE